MRTGRPKNAELTVSSAEQAELERLIRARTTPQAVVFRARVVLLCASGEPNSAVARELETTGATVAKWRDRFIHLRVDGLFNEPRPGRPRSLDDERVTSVIQDALTKRPKANTHWSVRTFAKAQGLSASMTHRLFRVFGLQPHRAKSFKLSADPLFVDKVRDIVGLYLDPPHNAMVLCVDEKSQIQALDRTQPLLPMGLGYVEGVTHDYVRHGTTTLFAALDVAKGNVIAQCKPRHRHQEFLSFLRHIDASVPARLDLHLVLDNYATHKHPKVRAWLAKRPRYHLHFTPTYSSWLNQVECWFGLITRQAIRRGTFRSVKELVAKIEQFTTQHNRDHHPFQWTATADSILAKIERLSSVINGTQH